MPRADIARRCRHIPACQNRPYRRAPHAQRVHKCQPGINKGASFNQQNHNSRRNHFCQDIGKPVPRRMPYCNRTMERRGAAMVPLFSRPPKSVHNRFPECAALIHEHNRHNNICCFYTHHHSPGLQIPHSVGNGYQLPSASINTLTTCFCIYRQKRRLENHVRARTGKRLPLSKLRRRATVALTICLSDNL